MKAKISKNEARRLAILAQAEALGVPAFMTPLWRWHYAREA